MRKYINHLAVALAAIMCFVGMGCERRGSRQTEKIIVSIAPLKYVVDNITGGDYPVEILVPEGASPETYSLTPRQMADIEKASHIFVTNLIDFEQELIKKLPEDIRRNIVVDVSGGVSLIYGSHCHHASDDGHEHEETGIDPHIWTSPAILKKIASTVYNKIIEAHPDSVKYTKSYTAFVAKLEEAENTIRQRLAESSRRSFIIYHPALGYYAHDFGLEQISIEREGKEPSAANMKEIVETARQNGVKYILYQRQFPVTAVETIAKDCGAVPVEVNPLEENIIGELLRITNLIAE